MRFTLPLLFGSLVVFGCASDDTAGEGSEATTDVTTDGMEASTESDGSEATGEDTDTTETETETTGDESDTSETETDTGDPCFDPHEPNDMARDATILPDLTDDDADESSVLGSLEGTESDWYRYLGTDTLLHSSEPTATVEPDGVVRFCQFLTCLEGDTTITGCPGGSDFATAPGGQVGCCLVAGTETSMVLEHECSGTDDSAQVLFLVDGGPAEVCTPVRITYHF